MTQINSLKLLILDLPPSCIEFWPQDSRYAVVGTYNLEKAAADQETPETEDASTKKSQQRNGSLILIQVVDDDVKIIQTLPTPSAILDLHFAPSYHPPSVFGVASSTGCFDLYKLTDPQAGTPSITHLKTIQYFPSDVLITAFSWHPTTPLVGMTLSSSEVYLAQASLEKHDDGDQSDATALLCSHDLEAWTLSFLPNGLGVYTGGDDSALKYEPLPSNPESLFDTSLSHTPLENNSGVSWTDKKIHGAGVTAILPLPTSNEDGSGDTATLVITGSYDDNIRLLDVSQGRRRTVLAETNLEGGVWRLKRLDKGEKGEKEVLLLVSCMHAGTRIVRLSKSGEGDGGWEFEVLGRFEEHKSMNYGSDCQESAGEGGERTVVSTSFYDRLLCLWRF